VATNRYDEFLQELALKSGGYSNLIICWKCNGALEILGTTIHEVCDNIPKTCPGCGADWSNSVRFTMPRDDNDTPTLSLDNDDAAT
jgi:hypothetical protein